jgi:hypothetical protein
MRVAAFGPFPGFAGFAGFPSFKGEAGDGGAERAAWLARCGRGCGRVVVVAVRSGDELRMEGEDLVDCLPSLL